MHRWLDTSLVSPCYTESVHTHCALIMTKQAVKLSKLMLKSGSNGAARTTPRELPKLVAKLATGSTATATAVAGMCTCQRIAYYKPFSLPQKGDCKPTALSVQSVKLSSFMLPSGNTAIQTSTIA